MKIIVVSDSHGNNKYVLEKLLEMEKPDMLFYLGDYVDDGEIISKALGIESIIVKGNGDYFNRKYKEDELVEIKNKKIFLTHGHKYNVESGLTNLYYKGLELGADIVLFGHTHIPIIEIKEDIIIMNPGSAFIPRTPDGIKTFGLLDIEEKINPKIIKINL